MDERLKKLNLQAILFVASFAAGYILASLWPGFFLVLLIPFVFNGTRAGKSIRFELSYLVSVMLGFSAGFLIALILRITSL